MVHNSVAVLIPVKYLDSNCIIIEHGMSISVEMKKTYGHK